MNFYEDCIAAGYYCQSCGEVIDGSEPGYPRTCKDCDECHGTGKKHAALGGGAGEGEGRC